MWIVETPIFTAQALKLLDDEEYRQVQLVLLLRPDAGALIPGNGGLRKLRWRRPGMGKRGGLRILYHAASTSVLYMLLAYRKSRQENLSRQQLATLRRLVRDNLLEHPLETS